MLKIYKIDASPVIDFAAEELKKYLRMMMPMDGEITIAYKPDAKDGFRLGLMQTFGLDVSDAEVAELDDILYMDTTEEGGIIAGDNARSVLLSVYEYLRQNGCRFLFPGVDGEYIPVKKIAPVKYRHKPSMRYRGQVNESATSHRAMLETIDFGPKVGQNCYMIQFLIPGDYYNQYYGHNNNRHRTPEPLTEDQVLQYKRHSFVQWLNNLKGQHLLYNVYLQPIVLLHSHSMKVSHLQFLSLLMQLYHQPPVYYNNLINQLVCMLMHPTF